MRSNVIAVVTGFLFAIGLGISGMTQPLRVLGFLDVAGAWDPTLAFVMAGAIGVHGFFAFPRRKRVPFASSIPPRAENRIDGRLLIGSALFGIGWGTAGYCPGPALVSLISGSASALVFVAAMLAGMLAYSLLFEPAGAPSEDAT